MAQEYDDAVIEQMVREGEILPYSRQEYDAVIEQTVGEILPIYAENLRDNVKTAASGRDFLDIPPVGKGDAVIVAAGPSVRELNQLNILADSRYTGTVIATDRMLRECAEHNIVPDWVVSSDARPAVANFFPLNTVSKVAHRTKAVFATVTPPLVLEPWLYYHGAAYYFTPLVDEPESYGVSRFMGLMTGKSIIDGLGNVSGLATILAVHLQVKTIVYLGLDLSWPIREDEEVSEGWEKFQNPVWKKWGKADLSFKIYNDAIQTYLKSHDKVRVISCSEAGLFFGEHIEQMKLREYLRTRIP